MVLIYIFILLEVVESLFWGDTLKIIPVSRFPKQSHTYLYCNLKKFIPHKCVSYPQLVHPRSN